MVHRLLSFILYLLSQVRRGFIRKVYGILTVQLLITIAIIAPFTFSKSAKVWAYNNRWSYWVAFGMTFVSGFLL